MGGTTIDNSQPGFGALQFQSSVQGKQIPVGFGSFKISGNLLDFFDWQKISTTTESEQGKGGVTTRNTTHTYLASVMLALLGNPASGVEWVRKGKQVFDGGYTATDVITITESYTVPVNGGTYVTAHAAAFSADAGVSYIIENTNAEMSSLIEVTLTPGQDYSVSGGAYTFGAAFFGNTLSISYQYIIGGAVQTALQQLGMSFFGGQRGQAAWSHLVTRRPNDVRNYSNIAYIAAADYLLGDSGGVDNHEFGVIGQFARTVAPTIADADPKDVAAAIMGMARLPSNRVGSIQGYSDYCRANNLLVSPVYSEQQSAAEALHQLVKATNSDIVCYNNQVHIVPYGDEPASANGATYLPNLTPEYELTEDHFIVERGEDPFKITRKPTQDLYNKVSFRFEDRAKKYDANIASWYDQADIDVNGLRAANDGKPLDMPLFKDLAIAEAAAQLYGHKKLFITRDYTFRLPTNFILLLPMDLVTLTDKKRNIIRRPVRITRVRRSGRGVLEFEAEDSPHGVNSSPRYAAAVGIGFSHDANASPGNVAAPVIFELPVELATDTGLQLAIAVTGTDAKWGGCEVWSSVDNQVYKRTATINAGARYGTLTAPLAAAPGGALSVQLAGLGGQLLNASAQDAAANASLCYVRSGSGAGEFVNYQGAILTAANRYTLSGLVRGVYDTPAIAQAAGAVFVRMGEAIAKSEPLDLSFIGKTIYFKFLSFNQYGAGIQGLADVSAYPYIVSGALARLPPPDLASFVVNILPDGTRRAVATVASEPADSDGIEFRYSTSVPANFEAMQLWGKVPRGERVLERNTPPAGTYWFAAAMRDRFGNRSATPLLINAAVIPLDPGEKITTFSDAITSATNAANAATNAASAAQTAANNAQTAASNATAAIDAAISDGILSPSEKSDWLVEFNKITNEETGIEAQATSYGIVAEKTSYTNSISALISYLNTLTAPTAWNSLAGNTTIVSATFRSAWLNVYAARQVLLNKIYEVAKTRADNAQAAATTAIANALAAQTSANAANNALADIASNNVLDMGEKPRVLADYTDIINEQNGIDARATAYDISAEKTNYDAAILALTNYLATLSAPVLWSNFSGNTTIVGTTFRTKFSDVYAAKQALLNRIAEIAGTRSDISKTLNLLKNADFSGFTGTNVGIAALKSWQLSSNMQGLLVGRNYTGGAAWNLGVGGAYVYGTSPLASAHQTYVFQDIPVVAGQDYELSATVSIHRTVGTLYGSWLDAAGNIITSFGDSIDAGASSLGSATALDAQIKLWVLATAPVTPVAAAKLRVYFVSNSSNTNTNCWVFCNRIMACVAKPGVTRATQSPWVPSPVENIHGGGIDPGTVDTPQIADGAATEVVKSGFANYTFGYYTRSIQANEQWPVFDLNIPAKPYAYKLNFTVTCTYKLALSGGASALYCNVNGVYSGARAGIALTNDGNSHSATLAGTMDVAANSACNILLIQDLGFIPWDGNPGQFISGQYIFSNMQIIAEVIKK